MSTVPDPCWDTRSATSSPVSWPPIPTVGTAPVFEIIDDASHALFPEQGDSVARAIIGYLHGNQEGAPYA
jgi:hypothetical protein